MLPCLNKKLLGIDCPGCGIQRAFFLVLQGEFEAAFKMYPAIYTLILLGIVLGIGIFYKNKTLNTIRLFLVIINVTIIIISYLIKMKIIF